MPRAVDIDERVRAPEPTPGDPDAPDETVADVARAGHTIGERVLRPAQGIVSRRPRAEEGED
jgi:molecular chaperone GrpE (heat shock protein)